MGAMAPNAQPTFCAIPGGQLGQPMPLAPGPQPGITAPGGAPMPATYMATDPQAAGQVPGVPGFGGTAPMFGPSASSGRKGTITDALFSKIDVNNDGVISRSEFRRGLKGEIILPGGIIIQQG